MSLPSAPDTPPEATMIPIAEDKRELELCWTLHGAAGSNIVVARIDTATGAVISAPHTVIHDRTRRRNRPDSAVDR